MAVAWQQTADVPIGQGLRAQNPYWERLLRNLGNFDYFACVFRNGRHLKAVGRFHLVLSMPEDEKDATLYVYDLCSLSGLTYISS